mgnify:CR=1 FL=1
MEPTLIKNEYFTLGYHTFDLFIYNSNISKHGNKIGCNFKPLLYIG